MYLVWNDSVSIEFIFWMPCAYLFEIHGFMPLDAECIFFGFILNIVQHTMYASMLDSLAKICKYEIHLELPLVVCYYRLHSTRNLFWLVAFVLVLRYFRPFFRMRFYGVRVFVSVYTDYQSLCKSMHIAHSQHIAFAVRSST